MEIHTRIVHVRKPRMTCVCHEIVQAKEKMMAEKLQREQLAGTKDEAQSTYDNAKDEYTKVNLTARACDSDSMCRRSSTDT